MPVTQFPEPADRYIICTSATRPSAPYAGLSIYETDTDLAYTYNGTAWVQMGGLGVFFSWTPVITQGAVPSLTVDRARYTRAGRAITGNAYVTCTSAGTASNGVYISLPVAAVSDTGNTILGSGWIYDVSAGFFYYAELMWSSATTASFLRRIDGAGASYLGNVGFTAALGVGDIITVHFHYEAAS